MNQPVTYHLRIFLSIPHTGKLYYRRVLVRSPEPVDYHGFFSFVVRCSAWSRPLSLLWPHSHPLSCWWEHMPNIFLPQGLWLRVHFNLGNSTPKAAWLLHDSFFYFVQVNVTFVGRPLPWPSCAKCIPSSTSSDPLLLCTTYHFLVCCILFVLLFICLHSISSHGNVSSVKAGMWRGLFLCKVLQLGKCQGCSRHSTNCRQN